MIIAITGGGTGGHLAIAKALAQECRERGISAIYVGSVSGQDRRWFENSDIFTKCYFLESTGVVNKRGLGRLRALWGQIRAIVAARKILKTHNVERVISVGGFSAGGAAMASVILKIPLFIHEQNSTLGLLNALLAPFAKAVFGSFPLDCAHFRLMPYPINAEFFRVARRREKLKSVLFLGGSQGAVAINSFALDIASDLLARNLKIIHQCGILDFERVKNAYLALRLSEVGAENVDSNADSGNRGAESGANDSEKSVKFADSAGNVRAEIFAFSRDLAHKMSEADFAISRAGASSIWELCAANLPCYLIPYPFAAKNHQYTNALFLRNLGLCEVEKQDNLNKEVFLAYLDSVHLARVSDKMREICAPNGAKEIMDKVVTWGKA